MRVCRAIASPTSRGEKIIKHKIRFYIGVFQFRCTYLGSRVNGIGGVGISLWELIRRGLEILTIAHLGVVYYY